jgi:hypothetical protein
LIAVLKRRRIDRLRAIEDGRGDRLDFGPLSLDA